MSDTAEPTKPFNEPSQSDMMTRAAATPLSALRVKAVARASAGRETTRLVCAASIALILGGVCGLWIHLRLASAYVAPQPKTRRPPDARQTGPADRRPGPESSPEGQHDTPSETHRTAPPQPRAELLGASPTLKAVERGGEKRASGRGEDATSDVGLPQGERAAATKSKSVKGAGRAAPCAGYASSDSLTLRLGGAASLVLGGPGGRGPVTVTTPDWSDIAVFPEGRAGAGKPVWSTYTVRSVSKRAGRYTLHVKSPCNSQTIKVRVTPP